MASGFDSSWGLHRIRSEARPLTRKLLAALLGAALLLPAMGSPVLASAQPGPLVEDYSHDWTRYPCVNGTPHNRWDGVNLNYGGWSARAVYARIDPPNQTDAFAPCTNSFGNDGASAWVAIVPGTGNEDYGSASAIIQIGIINCNGLAVTACGGGTQFHYFYADGGCLGDLPVAEDLGPANGAEHEYLIYLNKSNSTYYFQIDGVTRRTLSKYDGAVSCWIIQDKGVQFSAETTDGGDHYSYPNSDSYSMRLHFNQPRAWEDYTGDPFGWRSPTEDMDDCNMEDSSTVWSHHCAISPWSVGDRINVWSTLK
jgi:hypothetical protein